MGQLNLTNPVVIATSGDLRLLIAAGGVGDPVTDAQTWDPGNGYSDVKPLGVWLKFLYYVDEVYPPQPWVDLA